MEKTGFKFMFLFSACLMIFALSAISRGETNETKDNYSMADTLFFFKGNEINNVHLITKNANVNKAQIFTLENGVLIYNSPEQSYLRTNEEYENYKFHCEWRWMTPDEKGNSGVLIHVQQPDSVWPKCMQVQLKKDYAGDLLGMSGAQCDQTIGKPKDTGDKLNSSNEKPGIEWNDCDIICKNDSVVVYINGLLQNTGTNLNIRKGAIALQLESWPIMFRNVFIINH